METFRVLDEHFLTEPRKRIIFTIPSRALTPLINNTNNFAVKTNEFFWYLETERINRKTVGVKTSMNEVSVHGLMAGVEALTRSKVGTIFYDFLENIDSLQMALVINSAPKTLNHEQLLDYFRATEVSDKTHVSLQEAISLFKVIMNSLNNTVNQEYFSERIVQPVFIQVLKDTGEEAKLSDETQIKVSDFISELKRVAPFSVKFFSSYFEHVFLKQHDLSGLHMFDAWYELEAYTNVSLIKPLMPRIQEPTSLLNTSVWTTLYLCLPNLQMQTNIDLVYNSNSDGFSFNWLAYAIVGYKGPLCFLFEHEDEGKTYILGAYLNTTISDNAKFHGSADSCLFQVSPEVKMIWTYNNEGGENYVYLNTMRIENSNLVQGLGFGGVLGEFWLWIDNDIDTKSYLRPKDKTYEIGYLAGTNNKLNL